MSDLKNQTKSIDAPGTQLPGEEAEFHWRLWLFIVGAVVLVVTLFYQVENWRGRRAWERCKQEAKARGGTLDWNDFLPPAVLGDDNFFAAPQMSMWFVGRGSSALSSRMTAGREDFLRKRDTNPVVEITFVRPEAQVSSNEAEVMLRYQYGTLRLSTGPEEPAANSAEVIPLGGHSPQEVIPLIVMDEVPLRDAIINLARQAKLEYSIDPQIQLGQSEPLVSVRWENLTAASALVAVLNNYGLRLVPGGKAGKVRIVKLDSSVDRVFADRAVKLELTELLQKAISAVTNGSHGPEATAASAFTTFVRSRSQLQPARMVVRAEETPAVQEVAGFFPKTAGGPVNWSTSVHVEAAEGNSNVFRVWVSPGPCTAAADYLEWSDQLEPDFDLIREAIKRPYARMSGDYSDPVNIPIPNFVTVRTVAQTLSQRAQCHLLLGQPELALREVTLIHDFCRLLEGRPTSRPMTLVAAMINVAVRGLYASTVQDGLRLDAWREPQLAAIQEQLGQVNLLPYVAAAFECERVSSSHFMETLTTENYDRILGGGGGATKQWWGKFKDREYVYLALAPRGWVYQNMVVVARHGQAMAEAFDLKSGLVFPAKVDAEMTEIGRKLGRYGPYTFLAGIAVPNAMRALQTCARNQTLVNQAMVACALERHRLANGCYPKALAELMPQYLARIPADVIGGEPLKYRREDKGGFVLYSVGWNEKDDGGVTCAKSPADTSNLAKGDWVWPYRENMFR